MRHAAAGHLKLMIRAIQANCPSTKLYISLSCILSATVEDIECCLLNSLVYGVAPSSWMLSCAGLSSCILQFKFDGILHEAPQEEVFQVRAQRDFSTAQHGSACALPHIKQSSCSDHPQVKLPEQTLKQAQQQPATAAGMATLQPHSTAES